MDARAPFAALLRERRVCLAMVVGVAAHVALAAAGVGGMPCPAADLGVPCPGCGLTRALGALARLDLDRMLVLHALAPVAALGLALVLAAAVLPAAAGRRIADAVGVVERRTGFTIALCLGVVVYWGLRLAFSDGETLALVCGNGP